MGFPRILSKNNKIYTKLGEFCLSVDDNQFYIVCHTCQQELLTQDTFWKHIQDEHSFMHELKHVSPAEHNRQHNQSFLDSAAAAVAVEVPPPAAALVSQYRKINIKAEHECIVVNEADGVEDEEEEEEEQEPKDYTEMRVIEPSAVEVNIKVEQSHIAMASEATANHQQQQHQHSPTTLYMHSSAAASGMPSQVINYASILQNMPQVCSVLSPVAGITLPNTTMTQTQEVPKDSSSATSEDGERWFICDFKPCGQKFKYQSRLQLHSTVHSTLRRFVCDVCNASFKQSCNLSTHRKKKHDLRSSRMIK